MTGQVCVYKNLRSGLWSVTAVKGNGNRGPLLFHADELVLTGCRAVVKESRRKVIESGGWREVCAWFVGTIADGQEGMCLLSSVAPLARVTFRPRERGMFFRTDTGDDVVGADAIWFAASGEAWLLLTRTGLADGRPRRTGQRRGQISTFTDEI